MDPENNDLNGGAAGGETQPTTQSTETETKPEGGAAQTPPATETPPEPVLPKWAQDRINKVTREMRDMERRANLAEQALASRGQQQQTTPPTPPPATQTEQEAKVLAARMIFDQQCNDIYNQGIKDHGNEFKTSVDNWQQLGGVPPVVVEAALESGIAPKVILALGKDLDEAHRIMQLSPARAAAAVAKYAAKLEADATAAPEPKPGTKAPPPVPGVVGGRAGTASRSLDDDKISVDDWMKQREKELKARREAR